MIVEPIRNLDELCAIEKILSESERDLLLFTLGINCGLRISDILSLNVGDVRGKDYIQLTEKKTGKFKKFPINSKLKPMIERFTKNKKTDEALFKTIKSRRMSRYTAYRIIKNACIRAHLKVNTGTHTLRKTFGYHHYKKYKDVAMLQQIFNHTSSYTTLRYIGINQDIIDESYLNFIL